MIRHAPVPPSLPSRGADILRRQDEPRALTWLLAQRLMYRRAKRWNSLRVFGIAVLALAAPVISATVTESAEIVGAIAGAWLFVARTAFIARERFWKRSAASIQEQFDRHVFGLSGNPAVVDLPRLETVADLVGDNPVEAATKEHLLHWYPIDPRLPGAPAVAIAQRANAAYSERLQRRHASICLRGAVAWSMIGVGIAVWQSFTLARFLTGVVLPVLPAVLDAQSLWASARSAADDRGRLTVAIEDRIRAWPDLPLSAEQLSAYQDQLYRLRRDGSLVPDFLYWRVRHANERAMRHAAHELAGGVLAREAGGQGKKS